MSKAQTWILYSDMHQSTPIIVREVSDISAVVIERTLIHNASSCCIKASKCQAVLT